MAQERLQKIIARAGVASRRASEELILAGRVRVDGKVVKELGIRVDSRAKVELDGKLIEPERAVYVLVHKPRGVICSLKDPEGRPTIAEVVQGLDARLVPVGRLDFHTSGALLMTNDGDFAAGLTHPSHKVEKVYVAKVQGLVDKKDMGRWSERILIDDARTQPAAVRFLRHEGDKSWLEITLKEGKNRQIHRLGEHAGHIVLRLARLSVAGITTEGLRPGQWRHLTVDELKAMKRVFGVPKKVRSVIAEHWEASERSLSRTRLPRSSSGDRRSAPSPRSRDAAPRERPAPRGARDADSPRPPKPTGRRVPQRGEVLPPEAPSRGDARRREASPRGGTRRREAPPRETPSRGEPRHRGAPSREAPSRGEPRRRAASPGKRDSFKDGSSLRKPEAATATRRRKTPR